MAVERLVATPEEGGEEEEATEKSLALMLKSQYLSREFNDVFAATELREHEVLALPGLFVVRFISLILSTTEDDLRAATSPEERKIIKQRLAIKDRILKDPNAMMFVMSDAWLYAFGLCRQSLDRKSRKEGVLIATEAITRARQKIEQLGLGERLMSKLGLGGSKTPVGEYDLGKIYGEK